MQDELAARVGSVRTGDVRHRNRDRGSGNRRSIAGSDRSVYLEEMIAE